MKKNSQGQATVLLVLVIGALLLSLMSSIAINLGSLLKAVRDLKSKTRNYIAIEIIATEIKTAFDIGLQNPNCVATPAVFSKLVVGARVLCLRTVSICYLNQEYCLARTPAFVISEYHEPFKNEIKKSKGNVFFALNWIQKSFAQEAEVVLRPTITSPPTANITLNTCATPSKDCIDCGATGNANCFKVRICTNRTTTCTTAANYIEPVIGFMK